MSFQPDGIRSNTSPETCQVNDADSLGQVEMLGKRGGSEILLVPGSTIVI